ncbi:MAG: class I SAM-dependent DNA methyltransferase [Planctomycetes bacterium]|nr:class I SAM-dependent DNA methyltransferase [Planctomycetota bacterium]
MRLSLSEIRANAMKFAVEWKDAASERAEAQSFWTDLFAVFGIKRRSVASFEEKVKNLKGAYDRIDVFYSGVMLGEHKSRGEDLSKASSQAFDYVQSLTREGRASEIPQFIVVSDFETIAVYDLDSDSPDQPVATFKTAKLHENIKHLGFLSGYSAKPVDPEDPINVEAVEKLGNLHDALDKGGYKGHKLERFLVRVLFCLFADDTGIFQADQFKLLVKQTHTDGSDLGALLARMFKVLDEPTKQRSGKLPDELKDLPYVNGDLFKEDLGFADFDGPMRMALLDCCEFNWSRISPAVFGSLFQSIMAGESGAKKRRQIGAHYTSERDILKLVRSLFLDELREELESCGTSKGKLEAFQSKLASLRFLDPACGCGNFLVVTYRELRLLEMESLWRLHGQSKKTGAAKQIQTVLNIDQYLKVNVDQVYGIEIEEWPARIAEVAMWLIDHQMNVAVGEKFGMPVLRLPLVKSAKIVHDNALRIDWNDVLPAAKCSYVLGNPPFVGKKEQNAEQKADMERIWGEVKGAGVLDYVTCWYLTAAKYMKGTSICAGFVSTNSICQGEQVGILWRELLQVRGLSIRFAHNTFAWMSEARGKAHVHVVIIGFGAPVTRPILWDYSDDEDHPTQSFVSHISPYLTEGPDIFIFNRTTPLAGDSEVSYGSFALDDGNYTLSEADAAELLRLEPAAKSFVRLFVGAEELIHSVKRYCLWLKDAKASELRAMPEVMRRVEAVRIWRSGRGRETTRELAETPALFAEVRQPTSNYLAIPTASGERRRYIPMAYLSPEVVASNQVYVLANATPFHFGILTSEMHMAWVRQICGRLESRYRYSNKLVYNNFPWPTDATAKQKDAVSVAAQAVLDARIKSGYRPDGGGGQTLADLYDPLAMPKLLRDAHKDLDRAVDKCYRSQPFTSERQRVEYLFDLYQKLTAPLTAPVKARKSKFGR